MLIFTSVSYIDTTALEALENINHSLLQKNIKLHFSEVKGPVMDKLKHTNFLEQIGGQIFFQTKEAIEALTLN